MKKTQKVIREFEKLKSQLFQIENIVKDTKDANLWNHEASVRKKIKALKELNYLQLNDYTDVYNRYLRLFDSISIRLLNHYNKKHKTQYSFEDIMQKDKKGYINSGIISVLITGHIPRMVSEEFAKYFPDNPKDEYENARKLKRKICLHLGETNTGKTYNAVESLKKAKTGIYLAPLRILALENFEKLNNEGIPCNLITGEEEILIPNALHTCSTVEKLKINEMYDVAVLDEIQMFSDSQRGQAWTKALLGICCHELHICGALNAKELLIKIIEDCGDLYEITEYKRQTKLKVISHPVNYKNIDKGDAIVAFSKKRVLELSKFFSEKGIKNSIIYGDLPPEVRKMQYQSFLNGTNDILVTTDAIGMGVNLPIKRIIFTDLKKFDGDDIRYLTSQEIKQISGRAGRKGIYEVGYVGSCGYDSSFIKENIDVEDEPVNQAVIGPGEAIIKINGLPLKEKLALWSNREEKVSYYRKMDIRDYLIILENVKHLKLTEKIQFKLMRLPFDVNDDELLTCFLNFTDEYFICGSPHISKPKTAGNMLFDYEIYYQKLNLYYSFSKNFNLDFDPEWVYEERKNVSLKINELLLRLNK